MRPRTPPPGWYPRRGEVYIVRLDKHRPAVVLSVNQLNRHALDVCVVGITTRQHKQFSMRVPIRAGDGGVDFDCWAKCDQVTTLEKTFLQYPPMGVLSEEILGRIQEQVKICLGLG
ncbi:MAG: type II toxin-antitoxin system PemK/MazF family toxin [Candidatus Acidiferrales bacterium]